MQMFDGECVAVPMVRIVFEDLQEFVELEKLAARLGMGKDCLLYTSPSPRDRTRSRMPSSA